MKKLFFITILLLFAVTIKAQDQTASVMSSKNSTSTTLDSNATFTGTAELLRGYNSISVTVRSDSSGSYKILFGKTSTITTANAIKTYSFTYTANDTLHTKTVGADGPYFKVVYTSSADTQYTFLLTTMLNRGDVLPRTSAGKVDVDISTNSVGLATGVKQDSLSNLTKSILYRLKDGNTLTKPYQHYVQSIDTWGAAKDTTVYDFGNNYLIGYITVNNSSATADTLTFEVYSATKVAYTTQMIGFEDVVTGYREADNATVIIAGSTAKKFEITKKRPGQIRVRPKTLTGRTVAKTDKVTAEGIN